MVATELVAHDQRSQQHSRKSGCEPKRTDCRLEAIPRQMPQCCSKDVTQHAGGYSYRSAATGLARATRNVCAVTVASAISTVTSMVAGNSHSGRSMW